MISLKQIRYALAVEQHLHFNKAAEQCAISQSALSTAIQEMEKQLGFQIFERDNKKVLVTPLGRKLLDKAREIYLQMNDISRMSDAIKDPLSTSLSIGMIPTIAPFLLPRILPAIQENYPKLELSVVEDQSHKLVDAVISGELDTAVLALPYDCRGLLTFPFWREDFYWVTHRDDPGASKQAIHSDDMKDANLMLLKEGHCLKEHALAACKLPSQSAYKLGGSSLSTLVELVVGKLGTTLVPEMALDQLVRNKPELVYLHLDEPGPHREIAFIVRANFPSLHNIEQLIELIKRTLAAGKAGARQGSKYR